MGNGTWLGTAYASTTGEAIRSGTSFAYSRNTVTRTPRSQWKAHDTLDPRGIDKRESRDSDEHPNSTAIAVLFDVTGSMSFVPRVLQENLPKLHSFIGQTHNYVTDPQILFGAIGDATSDRVPLQVGQFESDNRMDENLENILLEGGGGGGITESYELAFYFMARHTSIDCHEKRGEKGYLFVIGDETAYSEVKPYEVNEIIGDGLQETLKFEDVVAECAKKYEIYFLIPTTASKGKNPEVRKFWEKHLPSDHVIPFDTPEDISELIGVQIGASEQARGMVKTSS